MLLKWTKTSSPSGLTMNPNPFFVSNHLTGPVGMEVPPRTKQLHIISDGPGRCQDQDRPLHTRDVLSGVARSEFVMPLQFSPPATGSAIPTARARPMICAHNSNGDQQ